MDLTEVSVGSIDFEHATEACGAEIKYSKGCCIIMERGAAEGSN
jgi:hypothetical protein